MESERSEPVLDESLDWSGPCYQSCGEAAPRPPAGPPKERSREKSAPSGNGFGSELRRDAWRPRTRAVREIIRSPTRRPVSRLTKRRAHWHSVPLVRRPAAQESCAPAAVPEEGAATIALAGVRPRRPGRRSSYSLQEAAAPDAA